MELGGVPASRVGVDRVARIEASAAPDLRSHVVVRKRRRGWVCGFWIYFANKLAGKSFSYVITGVSLCFVVNAFIKHAAPKRLLREIAVPLTYLAVMGAPATSHSFLS